MLSSHNLDIFERLAFLLVRCVSSFLGPPQVHQPNPTQAGRRDFPRLISGKSHREDCGGLCLSIHVLSPSFGRAGTIKQNHKATKRCASVFLILLLLEARLRGSSSSSPLFHHTWWVRVIYRPGTLANICFPLFKRSKTVEKNKVEKSRQR